MEFDYINLENALKKLGYSITFQKESSQFVLILKVNNEDYPVFLRILGNNTLLQVVMFLPCQVNEETLPDTLRLFNFFNTKLDQPGFCFDEETKLVFYRIVLHAFDKKMIPATTLQTVFETLKSIANTFSPLTNLVSSGNKTFNDILQDFKKTSKT